MEDVYKLFFQKGDGAIIDSYAQWGIVCCKVPFVAGGETKEVASREWHDEHGEDAYIPQKLMFKAYDAEFEMAYKGQELASNPFDLGLALTNITAFKKWLSGNDYQGGSGAELKIYSPYSTIGRQGCYLVSINNEDPVVHTKSEGNNVYHENVVTFKIKFRVTDPVTDIVLKST